MPLKHLGITKEFIKANPLQNAASIIKAVVFNGIHLFLLPIKNEWHAF